MIILHHKIIISIVGMGKKVIMISIHKLVFIIIYFMFRLTRQKYVYEFKKNRQNMSNKIL